MCSGGLLLGSLVLGAFSLLRPVSLTFGNHLFDILSVLYALILALVCFHGSRRLLCMPRPPGAGTRTARRFIPVLLGIAIVWATLTLLGWISENMRARAAPAYPSLFQMFGFGTYPFLIAAVLLLPWHNLSRLSRLRILLDSLIIMATAATLYGYFILVPILITSRGTLLEKTVGSLFTAADLAVLLCLLFVALQAVRVVTRQVTGLLALAMIILLVGHMVYLSLLISTRESLALRPTPGGLVSFALTAVAAQIMRRVLGQDASAEVGPMLLLEDVGLSTRWKTALTSTLALIFALLLASLAIQPANEYTHARLQVIEIGGTALLILLVLRQLMVTHELNILKHDLRAKNAQLDKLAASDPLTGVFNHRTLVIRLDEALAWAQEKHKPCSILFMDIDHFKAINDQHGHTVGDRVLCVFAESVSSLLSANACLGRWGGEEFVALLPGTTMGEAIQVAEQIRTRVAERDIADTQDLRVTCSVGVATYPQATASRDGLIDAADQAMYIAKRLGRNQTCLAQPKKDTHMTSENASS